MKIFQVAFFGLMAIVATNANATVDDFEDRMLRKGRRGGPAFACCKDLLEDACTADVPCADADADKYNGCAWNTDRAKCAPQKPPAALCCSAHNDDAAACDAVASCDGATDFNGCEQVTRRGRTSCRPTRPDEV